MLVDPREKWAASSVMDVVQTFPSGPSQTPSDHYLDAGHYWLGRR